MESLLSNPAFLNKRDYKSKDVDNIAKAILDAMKGIVFIDDVQVRYLAIQKCIGEPNLFIGILKYNGKENFLIASIPKLFSYTPYKEYN